MKIRSGKAGHPLYCDAGPYEGNMRIDLNTRLYLSPEEYARYEGSENLQITLQENGDGRLGTGNTAEPSAGDLVAGGEAALTVRRAAGRTYRRPDRGPHQRRARHPAPARPSPAQRPATPHQFSRKEPYRP